MILVTGAGGTIGGEVVKQLKLAGAPFRVGFRTPAKAQAAKAEGLETVLFDFASRSSLASAMRGADTLFLLSGNIPDQSQMEINAVEEAKKAGMKRIVKLSVLHADKESYTFARWHRAVEKAIERSGLAYTFLRPTGFMQNYVKYSGETIRTQGTIYNSGDAKVAIVDARDIGAVAVKALTATGHDGQAYELTGPETLSNTDVATKIATATGRPVKFVQVPVEAARQGMLAAGMPQFQVDAVLDLQGVYATGLSEQVSPDVERVLGRKPRSFDQFVRENVKAFQPAG